MTSDKWFKKSQRERVGNLKQVGQVITVDCHTTGSSHHCRLSYKWVKQSWENRWLQTSGSSSLERMDDLRQLGQAVLKNWMTSDNWVKQSWNRWPQMSGSSSLEKMDDLRQLGQAVLRKWMTSDKWVKQSWKNSLPQTSGSSSLEKMNDLRQVGQAVLKE